MPDISTRLSSVACGNGHVMALSEDGYLYGCGDNQCGQLGLPIVNYLGCDSIYTNELTRLPSNEQFLSIACSNNYSMALSIDGNVYGCGDNQCGQLGVGDCNTRNTLTRSPIYLQITQIACGDDCTLILDHHKNLYGCGNNEYNQLSLSPIYDPITINSFVRIGTVIDGKIARLMNNLIPSKPRIKSALSRC